MMNWIKKISTIPVAILLAAALHLTACQPDILSDDPNLRLSFSKDTLLFDTVFTTMGSSTRTIMVYNPNKNAVNIEQVSMLDGRNFYINLDGENNRDLLRDIVVRGGDSLFLFVRAHIDPQNEDRRQNSLLRERQHPRNHLASIRTKCRENTRKKWTKNIPRPDINEPKTILNIRYRSHSWRPTSSSRNNHLYAHRSTYPCVRQHDRDRHQRSANHLPRR